MSTGPTYNNADGNRTNSLLNILLGLGTLSLGAGITVGSLKAFINRFREQRRPVFMQPSKGLHNAYEANRIAIDSSYFPPELKEASYKIKQYGQFVKRAGIREMASREIRNEARKHVGLKPVEPSFSENLWNGYEAVAELLFAPWKNQANQLGASAVNAVNETAEAVQKQAPEVGAGIGKGANNAVSVFFTGSGSHTFKPDEVENYTQLGPEDSTWDHFKGYLSQKPSLWPLWFFPGAVGAVGLGWKGGTALVDWIDSLLGKSKQEKEYSEQAKKIYEESAKLLKDVSSGKIKPKMEKESSTHPAPGSTAETGFGNVGFPIIQGIAGLLLAGALAKQMSGAFKGHEDAQEELADRQHMLWAALAAQKERDYDYNGLYIDPDNILSDVSKDRKLNKKTTQMRSVLGPDDDKGQLRWENAQMSKIRAKTYR